MKVYECGADGNCAARCLGTAMGTRYNLITQRISKLKEINHTDGRFWDDTDLKLFAETYKKNLWVYSEGVKAPSLNPVLYKGDGSSDTIHLLHCKYKGSKVNNHFQLLVDHRIKHSLSGDKWKKGDPTLMGTLEQNVEADLGPGNTFLVPKETEVIDPTGEPSNPPKKI